MEGRIYGINFNEVLSWAQSGFFPHNTKKEAFSQQQGAKLFWAHPGAGKLF
jgi:hypothetical protein